VTSFDNIKATLSKQFTYIDNNNKNLLATPYQVSVWEAWHEQNRFTSFNINCSIKVWLQDTKSPVKIGLLHTDIQSHKICGTIVHAV